MNILVIQFREDASLGHERTCLTRLADHHDSSVFTFVNLLELGTSLPSFTELTSRFDKLILGGSGDLYVVETEDRDNTKSNQLKKILYPWLEQVLEADFPTLGTCFGFQLIVDCLGLELTADKSLRETGILPITIVYEGTISSLFNQISNPFHAVVGHKDSLPLKNYTTIEVLAKTDACVHAFQYKQNVFATQFHSELDEQDLQYRLELYPSYNPSNSNIRYADCHEATKVIQNFLQSKIDKQPPVY